MFMAFVCVCVCMARFVCEEETFSMGRTIIIKPTHEQELEYIYKLYSNENINLIPFCLLVHI